MMIKRLILILGLTMAVQACHMLSTHSLQK